MFIETYTALNSLLSFSGLFSLPSSAVSYLDSPDHRTPSPSFSSQPLPHSPHLSYAARSLHGTGLSNLAPSLTRSHTASLTPSPTLSLALALPVAKTFLFAGPFRKSVRQVPQLLREHAHFHPSSSFSHSSHGVCLPPSCPPSLGYANLALSQQLAEYWTSRFAAFQPIRGHRRGSQGEPK